MQKLKKRGLGQNQHVLVATGIKQSHMQEAMQVASHNNGDNCNTTSDALVARWNDASESILFFFGLECMSPPRGPRLCITESQYVTVLVFSTLYPILQCYFLSTVQYLLLGY